MYQYQNTFKLHRWLIEVRSSDVDIIGAVSEHVVNFKKNVFAGTDKNLKTDSRFRIDVLPYREEVIQSPVERYCYVESIPNCKMVRSYDFNKKQVLVSYCKDSTFPSPFLYHRFFLEPISQLLRSEAASLVHGAILSKKGEGILLIGTKGAGKSSLSAALIELGFDYYGDEHPILALERGRVYGRSFPSFIALDERSSEYFSDWKPFMSFHPNRGKYLLNPEFIKAKAIEKRCEIKKIIFLNPSSQPDLHFEKIQAQQAFLSLLKDPFMVFHGKPIVSNEALSHLELVARLSEQALAINLVYGSKDFRSIALGIQKFFESSSFVSESLRAETANAQS